MTVAGQRLPGAPGAPPADAPLQQIDAVLAEERLALEHHGRHAPMAGLPVRLLVGLDDVDVGLRLGRDGGGPQRSRSRTRNIRSTSSAVLNRCGLMRRVPARRLT